MDSIDTNWNRLASRAIRVVLARKDVSYARLAKDLSAWGVEESARSVEGKVQRGTFRFSFFLQTILAASAEYPLQWLPAVSSMDTWEARSAAVLKAELSLQSAITATELSRRLAAIGIEFPTDSLLLQIEEGGFPATLFLQCATVCRFEGIERFLDLSDLQVAARSGAD